MRRRSSERWCRGRLGSRSTGTASRRGERTPGAIDACSPWLLCSRSLSVRADFPSSFPGFRLAKVVGGLCTTVHSSSTGFYVTTTTGPRVLGARAGVARPSSGRLLHYFLACAEWGVWPQEGGTDLSSMAPMPDNLVLFCQGCWLAALSSSGVCYHACTSTTSTAAHVGVLPSPPPRTTCDLHRSFSPSRPVLPALRPGTSTCPKCGASRNTDTCPESSRRRQRQSACKGTRSAGR